MEYRMNGRNKYHFLFLKEVISFMIMNLNKEEDSMS